ncbi:MAG: aminoglycoside phosphotransferase family protein [Bacteroidales bacterium]|nr:aminoglycoside phosphotransferase family protein [Bacteroidales bacterium]
MNDAGFMQARTAAGQFLQAGEIQSVKPIGSGHIHQTFLVSPVSDKKHKLVLQKFNTYVFRDPDAVMQNLFLITSHIRKKVENSRGEGAGMLVLEPVKTLTGENYFVDAEGSVWRCLLYIPDTASYDRAPDAAVVYEGGKAFGTFIRLLSDLPAENVKITIPEFHNLDFRLEQFHQAIRDGLKDRREETSSEIEMILEREEQMKLIRKLAQRGLIPLRVVHHDTKINNVLFSARKKALCVIDLDTVMPGFVHDDFGDAIRTFTNTGEEDDPDLSHISMDLSFFEAFAEGFLGAAGDMLTPLEKEYLPLSALVMTYMQTIRFLTDYLNGDTYYKIHHPKHNLQRTKAQMQLLLSMEQQLPAMQEIVKRFS